MYFFKIVFFQKQKTKWLQIIDNKIYRYKSVWLFIQKSVAEREFFHFLRVEPVTQISLHVAHGAENPFYPCR